MPIALGNSLPLVLIAGPCVCESLDHARMMCGGIKEVTDYLGIPLIYKTSFDKANRTSGKSFRGIGIDECMDVFDTLKKEFGVLILTDVHEPDQCAKVAEHADILQIPALLCRQTDLIEAAAKTGLPVNIKKGQFLSPQEMKGAIDKVRALDNDKVMVTERGTFFGYNRLVNDFTSIPIMQDFGVPVIFDATHSVQYPGGNGTSTGGNREMVPYLARAATAVGIAGLFMEVHNDPDNSPSDGPNMLVLDTLLQVLKPIIEIDKIIKGY